MSVAARRARSAYLNGIATVILLVGCAHIAEVSPAKLFDAESARAFGAFVGGMFPPDVSVKFLAVVGVAIVRTLAIAVAGTALAALLALPLGYLATPSLFRRGVLVAADRQGAASRARGAMSLTVRGLLRFLRAVPDVMWGVLFVVAIGLGSLAGTLALALSYAGVLGRVYADVFEAVDPGPVEALHATGATRFGVFVTAIWPQAKRGVIAYTLYSFECCVRAASILGFIGAGGIGYEISVSMRLFNYREVTTLLGAYLVIVFASEVVSRGLRGRLTGAGARAPSRASARATRAVVFIGLAAATVASFAGVGIFSAEVSGAGPRAWRFASSLWPPDTSAPFLFSLPTPLLQTVAIGVVGTAIGIVLGAALTLPSLFVSVARAGGERAPVLGVVSNVARIVLAVLRSIPEMLWVLLCIVAIGLGPFAGTIAIGLHTAGVLGKLYADAIEEVSPGPALALRAAGASAWARLLWAALPQARPTLTSYTLLRFEANLRAATVVGLVGGGGIGLVLYNDIQLGFYDRVGALIVIVYGLVAASDWLTDRLRRASFTRSLARVADAPSIALLGTSSAHEGAARAASE
jgi:phosphonate transport system permease protein